MKFIQLVEQLARHVGTHHLPVNAAASRLHGLIESSAVHYELMTQILAAIYARNHCRGLGDRVDLNASFEALAPIRLALLHSPRTDVDTIRVLEDVCVALALVFDKKETDVATAKPRHAPRPAQLLRIGPGHRRLK